MNDSQQRARYNRSAMQANEDWYCNPPEDNLYEQERREDIQAQKEEWEWECKRDAELTNPKKEVDPRKEWCLNRRELTEDEQWNLQEKMHAFEKQQRWEQDVESCWKSMHGRY